MPTKCAAGSLPRIALDEVLFNTSATMHFPDDGPKPLGKKAQARLEKMGVEIQLNAMVTDVDRNGITVKDPDGKIRRIEAACKVCIEANIAGGTLSSRIEDRWNFW